MSNRSSSAVFRANSSLKQTIDALQSTLHPFANELAKTPSFISMGIFTADRHASSADTLTTIQNQTLASAKTAFHEKFIHNHRVGLQSTALGGTFKTGKTGFARSKMNPKQHIVWGVPIKTQTSRGAVAQLAFDVEYAHLLPSEAFLKTLWQRSEKPVQDILEALPQTSMMLSDELLLHVPVTPSHFVIQWDIADSTHKVSADYPVFKHFLQTFLQAIDAELNQKGTVVRFMGDGQMIALPLRTIDPLDPAALKAYGNTVALRLAYTILHLHKTIAERYSDFMNAKIRIAVGIGYLDSIQTTEPTGPILWEVAELLRRADRRNNRLLLTQRARDVLK